MVASGKKPVLSYTIIVLGMVLAAAAAVEPFYGDGYRLRVGLLLAGLLPYLVYAIIVAMLRRPVVALAGVALIVVHAWLVWSVRYSGGVNAGDGLTYTAPILLALALTPLWIIAMRQPWQGKDAANSRLSAG